MNLTTSQFSSSSTRQQQQLATVASQQTQFAPSLHFTLPDLAGLATQPACSGSLARARSHSHQCGKRPGTPKEVVLVLWLIVAACVVRCLLLLCCALDEYMHFAGWPDLVLYNMKNYIHCISLIKLWQMIFLH